MERIFSELFLLVYGFRKEVAVRKINIKLGHNTQKLPLIAVLYKSYSGDFHKSRKENYL